MSSACAACGNELSGKYCTRCGERRFRRLELRRIAGEVVGDFVNLDTVWLRTIRELTLRPGELLHAYLEGDRQRFVNPVKYLFIMATLYALVILGLEIETRPMVFRHSTGQDALAGMRLVFGFLGYLAILYLLPVAVIQSRLFRAHGLNVAETYASLCFYLGHLQFYMAFVAAVGIISMPYGQEVSRLAAMAYMVFWNARLFGSAGIGTIGKSVFIYLSMFLLSMLFSAALVIVSILIGALTIPH